MGPVRGIEPPSTEYKTVIISHYTTPAFYGGPDRIRTYIELTGGLQPPERTEHAHLTHYEALDNRPRLC